MYLPHIFLFDNKLDDNVVDKETFTALQTHTIICGNQCCMYVRDMKKSN